MIMQSAITESLRSMFRTTFEVTISKVNETRTIDLDRLHPDSFAYIFQYGLNKCLNDAHASVKRSDYETDSAWRGEVLAPVNERWEQLMTGDVPSRRVRVDPVITAERAIATLKKMGLDAAQITAMLAGDETPPAPLPPIESVNVTVAPVTNESVKVEAVELVAEIVPPAVVAETKRRNRGK
jgi:hypothetical protein